MQSDARRTYQLRSCGFDHHLAPIPPCDVAGPVEWVHSSALDSGIEGAPGVRVVRCSPSIPVFCLSMIKDIDGFGYADGHVA